MFKIESYITPLLMSYIDKYVKLRHEDFQLSLWGGDAVLNKLDLRLDTIEKMLHLPVTIASGHVHELRIHVPWTRLGSEPVLVTINTIECVIRVKTDSTRPSPRAKSDRKSKEKRLTESSDVPPGYVQSIINRILNNISVVVNNLIVKFVEDDIVLSMNVKSAEYFSVDSKWEKAFVDLNPEELVLRKVIDISDMTICLDRSDTSGRIQNYQDPLLYRCSLQCRLFSIYPSSNASNASSMTVNFFCEKFDLSFTDIQLPMFERLMELIFALYYGKIGPKSTVADSSEDASSTTTTTATSGEETEQQQQSASSQGWVSWAWSYVPQIVPAGEEGSEELSEEAAAALANRQLVPFTLQICFFCRHGSVIFKYPKPSESKAYGSSKVTYAPFVQWIVKGVGVTVVFHGIEFFDAQLGIVETRVAAADGPQSPGGSEQPFMLFGDSYQGERTPFQAASLFDPDSAFNQSEQQVRFIVTVEDHLRLHEEHAMRQRFHAFWFDYLCTIEKPEFDPDDAGSTSSVESMADSLREDGTMKFVLGDVTVNLTSELYRRLLRIYRSLMSGTYPPYGDQQEDQTPSTVLPSDAVVRSLEEFISSKKMELVILKAVIHVFYGDQRTAADAESLAKPTVAMTQSAPVLELRCERIDSYGTIQVGDQVFVSRS